MYSILLCSPDIDECELMISSCDLELQKCFNTEGDYKCECKDGYHFDKNIGKCKGNLMMDYGMCIYLMDTTEI